MQRARTAAATAGVAAAAMLLLGGCPRTPEGLEAWRARTCAAPAAERPAGLDCEALRRGDDDAYARARSLYRLERQSRIDNRGLDR